METGEKWVMVTIHLSAAPYPFVGTLTVMDCLKLQNFIQTRNCSKEIFQEFANTKQHLEKLIQKLPDFTEKCTQLQTVAADVSRHRRLTCLTLAKHTSLLEVLELPQIMETVVRNQHYEETLHSCARSSHR